MSLDASGLLKLEGDLHVDPELSDAVVLDHRLELLDPNGADAAQRARVAASQLSGDWADSSITFTMDMLPPLLGAPDRAPREKARRGPP
jgi:hypothetical protein